MPEPTDQSRLDDLSAASSAVDVADYRARLSTPEEVIHHGRWAGGIPPSPGIAPRVRLGRNRWFNLLWLLPLGVVVLLAAVAAAKGLRNMPAVQDFIARYPGTVETNAPAPGLPAWLGWQHFFNLFLIAFIIRSGWQILADHPRLYWTRHSTPGREWFRIQKPVPDDPMWTAKQDSVDLPAQVGLPGIRHSIGLARWWHLGIDTLWLLNGIIFYVLIFTTGHWHRLIPTTWEVFPNAASVLIQYLSLQWPVENGWVAYNGLQMLAYFITVFVAAPLAVISGLGMSPALSTRFKRISKVFSLQVARSIHFLVMVWFVFFIVSHVALVFTTGALRNLNHMFASRDGSGWIGFGVFAVAMAVVIVTWVAASPFTLRRPRVVQRAGAALIGPAQRLFEQLPATPGQYDDDDISPHFWLNGTYPVTEEYQRLAENNFADYRLKIAGLVENPVALSLDQLRALPHHEQITQHYCIQGWSGVAKWGGVSMSTIIDLVKPRPEARWVVFYSLAEGSDGGLYYDAHELAQMHYPLSMLAYEMNGEPLSYGHGAPVRLRNEVQLGFKQVKWIGAIEFVADFADIGGGHGGYNEDHEFFGYRQAI